jgi:hypothetical protein
LFLKPGDQAEGLVTFSIPEVARVKRVHYTFELGGPTATWRA